MVKKKLVCVAFFVLLVLQVSHAQHIAATNNNPDFYFKRYGSSDGFPLSSASSLIQDKFGFIWIGTSDGLYKYDGNQFIYFKFDPENDATISSNIINCLMEDDQGNIWIGTDNGGICCYVRRTKSFKRFPELYWKKEMFKIQSVTAIKQDSNGNIWFANSFFQYFIIDKNTLEIQPLKYEINEPIPEYYRISSMLEDKNKTMWLGTHYGLYYALVNKKSNKNNLFTERVFKKIPQITINDLFPNPHTSDSIYIVSNEGKIISFNVNNGGFKYEYTDIANEFTKNNETIESTLIDKHGNWWFASMRGGLYQFQKSTQQLHNFQNQVFNLNSLSFNYLNHIYEDKQGLIWICTDGGGINFLNPYAGNFEVHKYNPLDKNSISDNDIWSIYADKNYWLAGGSKGLTYYNKKNGKFSIYDINKPLSKEASLSFYSAIKKAPNGDIYVATEGAGVFIFDPTIKKFTPIKIQNLKEIGTSCQSISSITFDAYGNAWFGSFNEGLIKYNIEKKTAKVYLHKSSLNSIAQNAITSLLVDPYNHLWISLKDNGMDRMDIMTEKFIHFSATEKDAIRISSDEMLGLYLDSKNVLWAGSDRGINAINIKTNKVYTYNKLPGSSIDIVYAILEDSIGRYWFSSNKGIFSFESPSPSILFGNKTQADLLIESTLKNYNETDGLPSNEFNQGAFAKDGNEKLMFGGVAGLISFKPTIVSLKSQNPYLILTSFKVFEKEYVLDTLLQFKKQITLKYSQNYFSLEFISPSFLNPKKIQYKYQLEGVDPNWVHSKSQHVISYTNVSPGSYTFKLMATNPDGIWNENIKSIRIEIKPPFWRTTWFYLLTALAIIITLRLYVKWRERKLKRENKLLEEKVKLRTEDVILQKEIVEQKSAQLEEVVNNLQGNINYSLRIQKAILPDVKEIQTVFSETFIFYKPRNIVSGDFYFFAKQETSKRIPKYAVIAAADCTGHGVPGAFMSIIGSTLMGDIVNLKGITKPAHILDELQLGVTETLKINSPNYNGNEGMRAVVCKFDFEKNILEYAGAKLAAYIIRNHQVIELKPDKLNIGAGNINKYERFTENEFKLQKGDFLYLLTDGFSNQIGGDMNKKFKKRRLLEMLVAIHTMPYTLQEEQVANIFDNWKRQEEQIDDVLLIGIKL